MLWPAVTHLARTMPWLPLLAGCSAGVVMLAMARLSGGLQQPSAIVAVIRLGFVPVITGLSFLLHDPGRHLGSSFPAPGRLPAAAHLILAVPLLAATTWIQFGLATVAPRAGPHSAGAVPHPLPRAALSVELTACCALTIAVAALIARSHWDHLGGAVAAPVTLALIIALGIEPPLHLLSAFPAATRATHASWEHVHQEWALLMLIAASLACWASRDRWSRLHAPRGGPFSVG
jgi:fluoroquinolone transport system permease protein